MTAPITSEGYPGTGTCSEGPAGDVACIKLTGEGSCCAYTTMIGEDPVTETVVDKKGYTCLNKVGVATAVALPEIEILGVTTTTYCAGATVAKLAIGAVASIGMMASF